MRVCVAPRTRGTSASSRECAPLAARWQPPTRAGTAPLALHIRHWKCKMRCTCLVCVRCCSLHTALSYHLVLLVPMILTPCPYATITPSSTGHFEHVNDCNAESGFKACFDSKLRH